MVIGQIPLYKTNSTQTTAARVNKIIQ